MAQIANTVQPMDVSQTTSQPTTQTAEQNNLQPTPQKFYKVLQTDLVHHGFKYALGLNVDTQKFNPSGTCQPGGLYYTTAEHIPEFLSFGKLIAEVEPKGQIYADPEGKKWKTDKLYVHHIRSVKEWLSVQNESVQLAAIKCNSFNIQYIDDPSEAVQLAAVTCFGTTLPCIAKPTYAVQLAAVKTAGHVIRYIENPTEELQLIAVNASGSNINYIGVPTSEKVQLAAVSQNGNAVRLICNPSEAVKLAAVKNDGWAIEFIKDPTEEMQLIAVNKSTFLLRYIKNPTELVLQTAKRLIREDIHGRHAQSVVSMYVGH